MPLSTTTYDLEDEAERLDEKLDELADETANAAAGSDAHQQATDRGSRVEQQLAGVHWALDEFGEDATVTVGSLDTGEYAQVQDRTQDAKNQKVGYGDNPAVDGVYRIFFAAAGLVDAPFVEEGASFEARIAGVRSQNPQFTTWLEDRVDEQSTPDVDMGNGFAARVKERQTE